jgi:hypothetical protein
MGYPLIETHRYVKPFYISISIKKLNRYPRKTCSYGLGANSEWGPVIPLASAHAKGPYITVISYPSGTIKIRLRLSE